MKKNKSAFTLIELLVVIAIIAIIATITVVALQNSRANARDAKRLADVKQMQTALELYFNDNGSYPTSVTSTIASGSNIYMTTLPIAPTPVDGSCTTTTNAYTYSSNGSTYSITFCLGGRTSGLSSGDKIATRDGVANYTPVAPWNCGDTLVDSRDSQQYPTVQIGTQCWMAKNLAYLPSVQSGAAFTSLSNSAQAAYGVQGYSGSDIATAKASANYITYGVLYNWYAAVATSSTNGSAEGAQGACPTGWHVPMSVEFDTLTSYLGGSSVAGGKLKTTGTVYWWSPNSGATNEVGFNGVGSGYIWSENNGSFEFLRQYAFFWSSSLSYSAAAYNRYLNYGGASFLHDSIRESLASGLSVRCLKN